jgi:hypothetical protein
VHELAVGASYAGDAQPYRTVDEYDTSADDVAVSERR